MIPCVFNGSHWEVVWPECCGKVVVVNRLRDEVDLRKPRGALWKDVDFSTPALGRVLYIFTLWDLS